MKKGNFRWVSGNPDTKLSAKIMRWIARAWSLVAFSIAMMMVLIPDPHATGPIKFRDIFMLSFWAIAILGLLLAWRFERLGALITIITMPIREAVYILLYREWIINFLLIWALVIPPAVLYLLAWSSDRKQERASQENHAG